MYKAEIPRCLLVLDLVSTNAACERSTSYSTTSIIIANFWVGRPNFFHRPISVNTGFSYLSDRGSIVIRYTTDYHGEA